MGQIRNNFQLTKNKYLFCRWEGDGIFIWEERRKGWNIYLLTYPIQLSIWLKDVELPNFFFFNDNDFTWHYVGN